MLRKSRQEMIKGNPEWSDLPWYDPLGGEYPVPPDEDVMTDWYWRSRHNRKPKKGENPKAIIVTRGYQNVRWQLAYTRDQTQWVRTLKHDVLKARFSEGEKLSNREMRCLVEFDLGL